jgi:hypothetical protein
LLKSQENPVFYTNPAKGASLVDTASRARDYLKVTIASSSPRNNLPLRLGAENSTRYLIISSIDKATAPKELREFFTVGALPLFPKCLVSFLFRYRFPRPLDCLNTPNSSIFVLYSPVNSSLAILFHAHCAIPPRHLCKETSPHSPLPDIASLAYETLHQCLAPSLIVCDCLNKRLFICALVSTLILELPMCFHPNLRQLLMSALGPRVSFSKRPRNPEAVLHRNYLSWLLGHP